MNRPRWTLLAILLAALLFTLGCGLVSSLMGSSRSAGTVRELWPDVPRMDGLEKADLELPLAARLAIQAITKGRINFIAFTTTQPAQAVQDFYTRDRMQGQGWNDPDRAGCLSDTGGETSAGAVCSFGKTGNGKQEVLAIVIARDEGKQQTQVFFARIDTSTAQEGQ
jgi:hypothetical protein